MENNGRKAELMKPILLKAGIPLALSLTGFIYSMITTRRKSHNKSTPPEDQVCLIETGSQEEFDDQESSHDLNSTSLPCKEDTDSQEEFDDQESSHDLNSTSLPCKEDEEEEGRTQITDSLVSLRIQERSNLEEEILGLKSKVSAFQDKERELEARVLRCCVLKERELALGELQNMLEFEIAHVEFLGLTVESMETMVVEYLRVVEKLEVEIFENGVLQEKVNKLLRKNKERSRVLCRQTLMLRAREAEISRINEEKERREQMMKELEKEIVELKGVVNQLEEEKRELVEKLELGETSASMTSKIEVEETTMEDRAAEVKELVYLRWINACLRHEVLKYKEQERHDEEVQKGDQVELEYEVKDEKRDHNVEYDSDSSSTVTDHGDSCMAIRTISHKKPKLLQKLRKWVKEKENHQHNCVSRRSVSDDVVEEYLTTK